MDVLFHVVIPFALFVTLVIFLYKNGEFCEKPALFLEKSCSTFFGGVGVLRMLVHP